MPVTVDRDRMTVTIDGRTIAPAKQTWLLCDYLSRHPGYVRSLAQIMEAVHSHEDVFDTSVRSMIKRARKEGITCIDARHGLGYLWREG